MLIFDICNAFPDNLKQYFCKLKKGIINQTCSFITNDKIIEQIITERLR